MNREKWLEQRRYREGVGYCIQASEVAAILGFDDHRTALDVYVQKITGNSIEDNDPMLLGRCLEDGIARAYREKTDRPVTDPGDFTIFEHSDVPWLGATLDRHTWETEEDSTSIPGSPLELKNVGGYNAGQWADGPPLWLQIQLQMQIACSGAEWGAYCAVVGGSSIHYDDMDRSESFINSTIRVLEGFKWRLDNERPPDPTTAKCLNAVKTLYPEDSGETITLGNEHLDLTNELEDNKSTLKEIKKDNDEIEAKLRAIMGEATFGILNDGTMLTLKTTHRKESTRTIKASSYRTLRRSRAK